MPRLMSVAHTQQAVIDRTKTVTRRLGWTFLRPGDRLTLCRKVQGRRKGEPLQRLAEVEVVAVELQQLLYMSDDDVPREGLPAAYLSPFLDAGSTVDAWIRWYCHHMHCEPTTLVTRIEWRYLDA